MNNLVDLSRPGVTSECLTTTAVTQVSVSECLIVGVARWHTGVCSITQLASLTVQSSVLCPTSCSESGSLLWTTGVLTGSEGEWKDSVGRQGSLSH